ncbi:hypothetical protein KIPB_007231 [Kipferlia bialata]|uniref:Uncharacterized protein n=1 Tax=Kipferlia bialata TaxID=797122 RepID=A0A9K3GIW5_9EUKA|nr:hypothetical protein KIPB_002144 [Kipferlia bialata]GIQ85544.1 hypothetical protein KIPB_007231 [Kipferlia bialata]|eukprot:g2144.t1
MDDPDRQRRLESRTQDWLNNREDVGLGYSDEVWEEDEAIERRHLRHLRDAPLGTLVVPITQEQNDSVHRALQMLLTGQHEEFLEKGVRDIMAAGWEKVFSGIEVPNMREDTERGREDTE